MEEGFLWSSSLTRVFFSCVLLLFARWQPLSLSYANKKYHTYTIHLTTIYTRSNFHLLNFVYDSNKIGNGRTRIEGEFEYYLIEWESQEKIRAKVESSSSDNRSAFVPLNYPIFLKVIKVIEYSSRHALTDNKISYQKIIFIHWQYSHKSTTSL
jgi:hypothetical protein